MVNPYSLLHSTTLQGLWVLDAPCACFTHLVVSPHHRIILLRVGPCPGWCWGHTPVLPLACLISVTFGRMMAQGLIATILTPPQTSLGNPTEFTVLSHLGKLRMSLYFGTWHVQIHMSLASCFCLCPGQLWCEKIYPRATGDGISAACLCLGTWEKPAVFNSFLAS